jgi:hypothetical protein
MRRLIKYGSVLVFILLAHSNSWACEVCKKQQPEITQGLTHGAGPQSNWDWVIIAVISAITLLTLIYSAKYLIKPQEDEATHIKKSIFISLENE